MGERKVPAPPVPPQTDAEIEIELDLLDLGNYKYYYNPATHDLYEILEDSEVGSTVGKFKPIIINGKPYILETIHKHIYRSDAEGVISKVGYLKNQKTIFN